MGLINKFKSLLDTKLDVSSRYELLTNAVSGTMSDFHMARDKKSGDVIGLKVLDVEKTLHFESRFKGLTKPVEGEIAMQMDHPNIVDTLEHGVTNQGEQYVIMEFVEGPGLNALIKEKSEKLAGNLIPLMRQMAEALKYVHDAGFIHRDICPRNFICSEDMKSIKLIDFGLTVPATKEFKQPGNRTGTPNYMAPEVVRRRPTDHRLDIFSLGVTYYQMIVMQLPWPGGDVTGKAAMLHDSKEPVDILVARPQTNKELAQLIMSCVAKKPEGRPDSAADVVKALARITSENEA